MGADGAGERAKAAAVLADARAAYTLAAALMPWSGRAQNSLAVTAALAKDDLEAAYRYFRVGFHP
eukprot:4092966-Pyramimonas_sp.AAC.2